MFQLTMSPRLPLSVNTSMQSILDCNCRVTHLTSDNLPQDGRKSFDSQLNETMSAIEGAGAETSSLKATVASAVAELASIKSQVSFNLTRIERRTRSNTFDCFAFAAPSLPEMTALKEESEEVAQEMRETVTSNARELNLLSETIAQLNESLQLDPEIREEEKIRLLALFYFEVFFLRYASALLTRLGQERQTPSTRNKYTVPSPAGQPAKGRLRILQTAQEILPTIHRE